MRYMLVELMGNNVHVGSVEEITFIGVPVLLVRQPAHTEVHIEREGWECPLQRWRRVETHYPPQVIRVRGESIYRVREITEEAVPRLLPRATRDPDFPPVRVEGEWQDGAPPKQIAGPTDDDILDERDIDKRAAYTDDEDLDYDEEPDTDDRSYSPDDVVLDEAHTLDESGAPVVDVDADPDVVESVDAYLHDRGDSVLASTIASEIGYASEDVERALRVLAQRGRAKELETMPACWAPV